MDLYFKDLRMTDVPHLSWAGSSLHLDYIKNFIEKAILGDAEVVAGVLSDVIIAKGAVDYTTYPGFATISMVNVKNEFQGLGIGSKLFAELERRSKVNGKKNMRLHVEKENTRAISLYERLGYSKIGEVEEQWQDIDESGVIKDVIADCFVMEKDI